MVIRRRFRAIAIPLALYVFAGTVSTFFVWHAINGQRGLKMKDEYRRQQRELVTELQGVQSERKAWEYRVNMMRAEAVDRDILEEEARLVLGRVHKYDLVVFLPTKK